MAIIKSYTDLSQSNILNKILPIESADMGYLWNGTSFCDYPVSNQTIFKRVENIPCWSLAALLGVLPNGYVIVKNYHGFYFVESRDHEKSTSIFDNPVDACYEMIIRLNELNLL